MMNIIYFFLISGTRYQRILQLDDILQILFALTKYIRKKKWEQKNVCFTFRADGSYLKLRRVNKR